jgi:serine/threonine protein phosphatase 1
MPRLFSGRSERRSPRLPDGVRIYVIGDVHGRADLLERVFSRIDTDLARRPSIEALHILLGDYVDRGRSSKQVIDLLIRRGSSHKLICLKGNHESCLIEFLRKPSTLGYWQQLGGSETLMSYGLAPPIDGQSAGGDELAERFAAALPRSHVKFLSGLKSSFICGDFFFVHAGIRPGIPLSHQRDEDLLWIRDDFLLCEEDFGKLIVHGHTPVLEPEIRPNRINVDTGAYATGKLTCLILEQDAVFAL